MKRTIIYVVVSFALLSCNSISTSLIPKEKVSFLELGQIIDSRGILQKDVEVKTTPNLEKSLRISLTERTFTPSLLKKYANVVAEPIAQENQGEQYFYELELIDDVGYIESVNEDINVSTFVQDNETAGVITKLSFVSIEGTMLDVANTYFLKQSKDGVFYIEALDSENNSSSISFNAFQVFDYSISTFCYGFNDRRELQVMDLVEDGKSCRKPLRNSTKPFKKVKSLFDY